MFAVLPLWRRVCLGWRYLASVKLMRDRLSKEQDGDRR